MHDHTIPVEHSVFSLGKYKNHLSVRFYRVTNMYALALGRAALGSESWLQRTAPCDPDHCFF
jgi:hypothetical protein